MGKKKKKNGAIDINQTLIDNLEVSEQVVENNEEDEFESLLNSFLNSDQEYGDNNVDNYDKSSDDLDIPEPNIENNVRVQAAELPLGNDELELAQAYANFTDSVTAISVMYDIALPTFGFNPEMLVPNYKPSTGRKIVSDASLCWDVMFQAFPERLSTLNPLSTDEEFLNFAS